MRPNVLTQDSYLVFNGGFTLFVYRNFKTSSMHYTCLAGLERLKAVVGRWFDIRGLSLHLLQLM
jgi:hypothetical protein